MYQIAGTNRTGPLDVHSAGNRFELECEPFLFRVGFGVLLSELTMGASAVVQQVDDNGPDDTIAQRLRDLVSSTASRCAWSRAGRSGPIAC